MLGRTRLGLIPLGEEGEPRITAFVQALGDALGEPIDLHRAADYRALASAVEQGLVHLAWLPPLAAARAVRTGAVSPVAVAVRSGATSYYAGLITQESSRIRTTADLKGL
ncbi:MAG TPA: PhnD/SsuA/transferrin family substrate-binding protein, partial [Polyangiaceae bacterium]